jgi:pimeloyl-ACP methyl ester carboxylesterase
MRRHAPLPSTTVTIETGTVTLQGILGVPPHPRGIVLFAHGSVSGRLSPRNAFVAGALREVGLATLLFDLLSEAEAEDRRRVFDIPLLARRLRTAAEWVRNDARTCDLPIAYFGASTGAAAALVAAADDPAIVAVVARGGRPDLAEDALPAVRAPTLLLVGSEDGPVIGMNQWAIGRLRCEKHLTIVPGAGHLFEEPGTLELVVAHAIEWYRRHLPSVG